MRCSGWIVAGLGLLSLYIAKASPPPPLGFDEIAQAIRAPGSGIASVEQLLAWIATRDPEYLAHFTLMRESHSLQGGSPRYPRAIVFGKDARLLLAFNGDPADKGYQAVEIIQYRQPHQKSLAGTAFELREIELASGKPPRISPPNPGKCLQCHYTPARPIWDPYETWDGAYGRHDDALIDFVNDKYAFTGSQTRELMAEHARDLADYREFQKIAGSHPRYRYLRFTPGSPVSPFSPRHRGEDKYRPNLLLTTLLSDLNAQRVAGLLLASARRPCLSSLRAPLLQELKACGEDQAVSGESFARTLEKLGIEKSDLNLRALPQGWSYFVGDVYASELVAEKLYPALRARDPALPPALPPSDYELSNRYPRSDGGDTDESAPSAAPADPKGEFCAALRALPASGDPTQACPSGMGENAIGKQVAGMCWSCHDGSVKEAAVIPFDRPEFLGRLASLRASIERRLHPGADSKEKRMPPLRPLTAREDRALRAYLGLQ